LSLPHVCFIAVHIYPVLAGLRGIAFVGGAEVQQSVQMRAMLRAGCRISVLTKDHGQPDVVDCDGITVYKIPDAGLRGLPGLRFFHPRMSDLVRLLRRISPDIVFMQTAGEQVASAAVYARLSGRPFVFAGASDKDFVMGPLPGMPPQHTALYRWGLRAAQAVVVQNVAQLELLKRHFQRDGHLIQNGYEEPLAQPGAFDGSVLWAATVKPLKRPDLVLALARRLRHLRFLMVGGPGVDRGAQAYFDGIARQAHGLSNLTMTGHVPFRDVGAAFDGASVCLNTSDYEGLPNTFMQAWLRGIPTLSFVRPESAPGISGTLACDDLDHMALRLDRLTRDRAAWTAASQACRRHFDDHHTIDVAVQRYLEVFDRVLQGRRPAVAVTAAGGGSA
jgi:glycosyltransferase involved in cell wall biosynthesis